MYCNRRAACLDHLRRRGHDAQAYPSTRQGPCGSHHEAHLPYHRQGSREVGVDQMGQKVNPTGIRLGIVKDHSSVWYAEGDAYADKLNNDLEVRRFLEERLKNASVSRISIERPANNARITIHTARPGIVIGKKGEDVDRLRREITTMMGVPVHINIEEVRKPELDAKLVAQNIAGQLERRVMFRRTMKRAVQNAMRRSEEHTSELQSRGHLVCRLLL